jgi:hypothetical protein
MNPLCGPSGKSVVVISWMTVTAPRKTAGERRNYLCRQTGGRGRFVS